MCFDPILDFNKIGRIVIQTCSLFFACVGFKRCPTIFIRVIICCFIVVLRAMAVVCAFYLFSSSASYALGQIWKYINSLLLLCSILACPFFVHVPFALKCKCLPTRTQRVFAPLLMQVVLDALPKRVKRDGLYHSLFWWCLCTCCIMQKNL